MTSPSGRREQPLLSFPLFATVCPLTPSCRVQEHPFSAGETFSAWTLTGIAVSPEDASNVARPAACPPWRLCLPHLELGY